MESRDALLTALSEITIENAPAYPKYTHKNARVKDAYAMFQSKVEAVGGACTYVKTYPQLRKEVEKIDAYLRAQNIVSTLTKGVKGNVDMAKVKDVHDLQSVNVAIVGGEFGVAESGAVWVNGDTLAHRGVLFLTETLILVVESGKVVADLERAYQEIDFTGLSSGYFISGPSKTADIEQSLVYGAHGAKSLYVFVMRK